MRFRIDSRELSGCECSELEPWQTGLGFDLRLPPRDQVVDVKRVALDLDGTSVPAQGAANDELCQLGEDHGHGPGTVCASVAGQDLKPIDLMAVLPNEDWARIFYRDEPWLLGVPADWGVCHAALWIELELEDQDGCCK